MQNVLADGMGERPGPPGNTVGTKKTSVNISKCHPAMVCVWKSSGRPHTRLNC